MGLIFSPIANGIRVVFAKEKITMKIIKKFCVLFLPVLFLITLPFVDGHHPVHAENPELSTAVFYVQ
jgi:hypothetical protein